MTDPFQFSMNFRKFHTQKENVNLESGLHVIYGESGVGKSSFVRQVAGVGSSEGANYTLVVNSVPGTIQVIFQNPDTQIVGRTLENELAFSLECYEQDPETLQTQLELLKDELLFETDFQRSPATLSGGEKEILNVITAFSTPAKLILIDDGLSFLSRQYKDQVIDRIRDHIRKQEKTVVWFTSDITDLKYGDTTWEMTLSDISRISNSFTDTYPDPEWINGKMGVSLDSFYFAYPGNDFVIENINLQINASRCIGIVGLNGSGKTTLAAVFQGLLLPTQGTASLSLTTTESPRIGALDQFPERLLGSGSFQELVEHLEAAGRFQGKNQARFIRSLSDHQITWDLIKDQLGIDLPWPTLRLALIILLTHCDFNILILDEPTFGMGWKQKLILHKTLHSVMKYKHLLIISHDLNFVKSTCDCIYALDRKTLLKREGKIIGT